MRHQLTSNAPGSFRANRSLSTMNRDGSRRLHPPQARPRAAIYRTGASCTAWAPDSGIHRSFPIVKAQRWQTVDAARHRQTVSSHSSGERPSCSTDTLSAHAACCSASLSASFCITAILGSGVVWLGHVRRRSTWSFSSVRSRFSSKVQPKPAVADSIAAGFSFRRRLVKNSVFFMVAVAVPGATPSSPTSSVVERLLGVDDRALPFEHPALPSASCC